MELFLEFHHPHICSSKAVWLTYSFLFSGQLVPFIPDKLWHFWESQLYTHEIKMELTRMFSSQNWSSVVVVEHVGWQRSLDVIAALAFFFVLLLLLFLFSFSFIGFSILSIAELFVLFFASFLSFFLLLNFVFSFFLLALYFLRAPAEDLAPAKFPPQKSERIISAKSLPCSPPNSSLTSLKYLAVFFKNSPNYNNGVNKKSKQEVFLRTTFICSSDIIKYFLP